MLLQLEITLNAILFFKKHTTEKQSAISQALFKILLEGFPVLTTSLLLGLPRFLPIFEVLYSSRPKGVHPTYQVPHMQMNQLNMQAIGHYDSENYMFWKDFSHHIYSCSHRVSSCPILSEPHNTGTKSMML